MCDTDIEHEGTNWTMSGKDVKVWLLSVGTVLLCLSYYSRFNLYCCMCLLCNSGNCMDYFVVTNGAFPALQLRASLKVMHTFGHRCRSVESMIGAEWTTGWKRVMDWKTQTGTSCCTKDWIGHGTIGMSRKHGKDEGSKRSRRRTDDGTDGRMKSGRVGEQSVELVFFDESENEVLYLAWIGMLILCAELLECCCEIRRETLTVERKAMLFQKDVRVALLEFGEKRRRRRES